MSSCKKRTPIERVRYELYGTNRACVVALPLILLITGIFTRWVSGSPIPTLHYIGVSELIPPTWLMVLLFGASYIVAGLAFGLALGERRGGRGEKKYQGAMWFCLSLCLGYAWYPIFFCVRLFLVSAMMSVLCLFCSICASVCFAKVSAPSAILAVIYDLWLAYLTLLNAQIFFAV